MSAPMLPITDIGPVEAEYSEEKLAPGMAPEQCRSFSCGHMLHYLQARQLAGERKPARRKSPGVLVSVAADGWIEVLDNALQLHRRWTHNPYGLAESARDRPWYDYGVEIRVTLSIHWCYLESNRRAFSIHTEQSPCVIDEPSGDLTSDLTTHGGFLVTGADALSYAAGDTTTLTQQSVTTPEESPP